MLRDGEYCHQPGLTCMRHLLTLRLSVFQDVEHAVLFSQSLCMSAFELRTSLPCSQAVWEADSAEAWRVTQQQVGTTSMTLGLEAVAKMADTIADSCSSATSAVSCTEDLLDTSGCS